MRSVVFVPVCDPKIGLKLSTYYDHCERRCCFDLLNWIPIIRNVYLFLREKTEKNGSLVEIELLLIFDF